MKNSFLAAAAAALLFSAGPASAWLSDPSAVGPLTNISTKSKICDVTKYGATPGGTADVGAAIQKAFSQCVVPAGGGTTLYVPAGEYTMSTPVKMNDQDRWAFQLDGLITMDHSGSYAGNLFIIERVNDFEMFSSNGKGAIQGQGYLVRTGKSSQNTRLLRFLDATDYAVHDLILVDSPTFHLIHNSAKNLEVYGITIRGGNKGGLDGIDIDCVSNCYIHHSEVTNRDECVSVKTPSTNVLIEDMYCNQSGGMSIGSLNATNGAQIEFITMRNINIMQCTQALMLKTFPGGKGANGYIRNSIFENFWAYDTTYSLDIDQYWQNNDTPNTGAIAISNLVFRNWTGTVDNGISRGPIVIRGSDQVPLTNITLEDFGMWTVNQKEVVLQCANVYGSGYCAKALAADATPTTFTTAMTITTTMSGYAAPTSPAWGLPATGYGTASSIPVYTPAAMFAVSSVVVQGASAAVSTATATAASGAAEVESASSTAAAAAVSSQKTSVAVPVSSTAAAAPTTTSVKTTSSSAAPTKVQTTATIKTTALTRSSSSQAPVASQTTTTTTSTAAAAAAAGSSGAATAKKYYQCGGTHWEGAIICEAGATCTVQNEYYSQCL